MDSAGGPEPEGAGVTKLRFAAPRGPHHRHRHPAVADRVYCAPSPSGYRVCTGPSGYSSNEWSRQGMQFGQDSGGRRWMISGWQGIETTTVTSAGQ